MAANPPSSNVLGGAQSRMDKRLLKAASCGDSGSMKEIATQDPSILLGKTPHGNNCLHISSIHGHEKFCDDVLEISHSLLSIENFESLLSSVNSVRETPLVSATTLSHASLAFLLLRRCNQLGLRQTILQQDNNGFNALHHAIRNGHTDLALALIDAEPALSKAVTSFNESPMFIAVMKNLTDVFEKLLETPDSAHVGQYGRHALHAAARNGNSDIANKIMEKRPHLAREADSDVITPVTMAVTYNKVDVLRVLLEHDSSLGYEINNLGYPLLCSAAALGQVDVARELLKHCPDALCSPIIAEGNYTCLHLAVLNRHPEFVEFIIRTRQLRKLINMQDMEGRTALHYAVQKCDPRLVAVLLSHKHVDTTLLDNYGKSATSQLSDVNSEENGLDMKEVYMLMLGADPNDAAISLHKHGRRIVRHLDATEFRRQRKSQTQTYKNNTSLVAVLLATITFTAAFTLPGGYSSDPGSLGLPIMSRKTAFQAFLISDALAMCSSFVVAFICLMGKWEDDKYTTYYTSITKKLTWFAYMTTITAFSTGLYTVLDSDLHWLAVCICSLVASLPVLTIFIREWPHMKVACRMAEKYPYF